MNLRDFVLSSDDTVYEKVLVPEWGNREVWLRTVSSEDRDAFEASLIVQKKRRVNGRMKTEQSMSLANVRAKLVVFAICKGEGNPELEFKPEDAEVLAKKSAPAIDRLYSVAQRLAGITEADIEELAGN